MAAGQRQDLQGRALEFSRRLLGYCRDLERADAVPRRVAGQAVSAGTAIGANLEEAIAATSRRQMANTYAIALREARECLYWLRLMTSVSPHDPDTAAWLVREADEFVAILTVSVRKLRMR